jgi:ParB-like chromosome segregation protein Spo0J
VARSKSAAPAPPPQIPETLAGLVEPIDSLTPRARNPRRGDVAAVRESLIAHGQFRPLVANRPTREVLAGNHTLEAARELGWTEVAVTWVDVDEETAKRIVIVDNRTSDLATWDNHLLSELLGELPGLDGTGFAPADLDALLSGLQPPDEFPNPEDGGPEAYQCPSCGYEWSGAARLNNESG